MIIGSLIIGPIDHFQMTIGQNDYWQNDRYLCNQTGPIDFWPKAMLNDMTKNDWPSNYWPNGNWPNEKLAK